MLIVPNQSEAYNFFKFPVKTARGMYVLTGYINKLNDVALEIARVWFPSLITKTAHALFNLNVL
jgi:hypothetical protein